MRILHTSDLHLSENKPETLDALNEILRVAKKNSVELVTIAGDIFDSQKDAEALRGHIRPIFDDLSFEVLAIPGNHDGSIFSRGYDFGFRVVTAKPYEEIAIGDLTFIAVPYSDESPDEILLSLMSAASTAKTRILLLHCTLDIGFDASGFGEESSLKYFPVSKIALAELNYDYILAGHFHSKCEVISLSEKSKFIYPGSPTSHSWKETGCRHGVLIDTEKRRTSKVPLSTRYYDRLALKVTPGKV